MKKSKRVGNNVAFFVLLTLSVLFLVPIIIVIINSFKSRIYISSQPLKLPNDETFVALENYINGVTSSDFYGCGQGTVYSLAAGCGAAACPGRSPDVR